MPENINLAIQERDPDPVQPEIDRAVKRLPPSRLVESLMLRANITPRRAYALNMPEFL